MKRAAFLVMLIFAISLTVSSTVTAAPKKNKKNKDFNPLAAQNYLRQGNVLMQQDRFDEALERFKMADASAPNNATVYNMMGLCYLSMGELDMALTYFDRALQLIPGFTDARNNRGSTYLALEQYRMAEVDFIAVLSDSTYPHRWKVFYNLGMTYLSRGQMGAAEENFNKAITAPMPVFEAYLRLAEIAESQGRIESALGILEEARLNHPDRMEGTFAYGRLLMAAGRPEEGRRYLEKVIASDPSSAMADAARECLGES